MDPFPLWEKIFDLLGWRVGKESINLVVVFQGAEDLFLKQRNLNEMILQMKIVGDELQKWTEENNNFLKKIYSAEYTIQGLLREMTKTDYLIEKLDNEDRSLSGNEKHQKLEVKKWEMLGMNAEKDGFQPNQHNWQKSNDAKPQDPEPLLPAYSLLLSEEDPLSYKQDQIEENLSYKLNYWKMRMFLQVKELIIDHKYWIEKNDIIVQKINATEETVKSLLSEVIKMENQMKQLESNQCQYLETEEAVIKQDFYEDMTVMNRELEKYQLKQQEESEAEMIKMRDIKDLESLSPQTLCLDTKTSSCSTKWKHVLWIFVFFSVFTIFGFSYYIFVIDPTFIFETMLPRILGRQRLRELRELIVPFLYLEVDDLLPT
ncbi:single-pass membrane and coiled-coil domain-containing protein 2 [Vombatus ursinus]|uniref:single-pass membrane and coiled-coil domain-containing protein 2 n=1 Tax=Vombatus ursinus TaxID=29139 RepID=UPI000FFD176B|nr:single-pass membrane and coiled-coil domain-containing protein 2 [Vombatus ursinus]